MAKYEINYTRAHMEVNLTSVFQNFSDEEKGTLVGILNEFGMTNIHMGNIPFVNAYRALRALASFIERNNVEVEIIKTQTIMGNIEKHLVRASDPRLWTAVKLAEKIMGMPESFDPIYFDSYYDYKQSIEHYRRLKR